MPRKVDYSGECDNRLVAALFDSAVKKLYEEQKSPVFSLGHSCVKTCAALLAHMDRDGRCFPGRNAVARLAGISPNTVTACVKKLEAAGIVRVERRRLSLVTRSYYTFVDVRWAKTMTWTSGENEYEMNTEQNLPQDNPTNWVEFAADWMLRNRGEAESQFVKQIRTACDQRGVDDLGQAALINFSNMFPEVPFARGMWMGVGNANVKTLVLLRAYDIRILSKAVQMRRDMLAAMGEEAAPPAHPLQLQSFLAQATAMASIEAARAKKAEQSNAQMDAAGYMSSSDLEF